MSDPFDFVSQIEQVIRFIETLMKLPPAPSSSSSSAVAASASASFLSRKTPDTGTQVHGDEVKRSLDALLEKFKEAHRIIDRTPGIALTDDDQSRECKRLESEIHKKRDAWNQLLALPLFQKLAHQVANDVPPSA
eukprot:ANDGO_04534.mRNA.1 hypothetical protein